MALSEMSQEQKSNQYQKCNYWFLPAQLKAKKWDLEIEIYCPNILSVLLNAPNKWNLFTWADYEKQDFPVSTFKYKTVTYGL